MRSFLLVQQAVCQRRLDSTSSSATRAEPDSDVNYGIEIGFKNIADTGLRLGGSYLYSEPDVKSYDATTGALAETSKAKQKIYLFNAYYDFKNSSALTPFIGAGLGSHDWDTAFKELELFPWVFSFIKK